MTFAIQSPLVIFSPTFQNWTCSEYHLCVDAASNCRIHFYFGACTFYDTLPSVKKRNVGSAFDDLLREENLLERAQATAIKRVIAYQIAEEMKQRKLSKTEMADKMKTSRAALERLLDPSNSSVTLSTLERAASALGKKLKVELA